MNHPRLGCAWLSIVIMAGTSVPALAAPPPIELDACADLEISAPDATFLAYEPTRDTWSGCNIERAEQRFLPASTFKIPHALIALETGVVVDEHAKEPWDGVDRGIPAWNQPTSLASGMANSTVWFYQQVSSEVGATNERRWLARLEYGNQEMGADGHLTHFWLSGDLRISAGEQVAFLSRLRAGQLPARQENQERVRKMMLQPDPMDGTEWPVYGKTGAVLPIGPSGELMTGSAVAGLDPADVVGWFVGWVDRPEQIGGPIVFALNLDLSVPEAMGKRVRLSRMMLDSVARLDRY